MNKIFRPIAIVIIFSLLQACAATDQFAPRIYSSNINSQVALDHETLLNIARASRLQPLTFVAITKAAGNQNSDLKIGLPTFNLASGLFFPNNQALFSGNMTDNSIQGTFESNPLISSVFQQGMMSPISPKTLALLLTSHPREIIFYAAVDGIKMSSAKHAYYFKNDPSNDAYDKQPLNQLCRELDSVSPGAVRHAQAVLKLRPDYNYDCNFSEFSYLLEYALAEGLTAYFENPSPKQLGSNSGADSSKQGKSTATVDGSGGQGYLCFDPTLARPELKAEAISTGNPCGAKRASKDIPFKFGAEQFTVELRFRSPLGIYAYLGKLLREGTADRIILQDPEVVYIRDQRFVDVTSATTNCTLAAVSDGIFACVPPVNSASTLVLIDMLEQLRNLNISPADLNSSVSVRLSD